MTIKQTLGAIVVLVVVAAIAAGLSTFSKPPAPAGPAAQSPVLHGTVTANGDYSYKEDQPYYTVDVTFPATLPLSASASAKAELIMEQAIADDIAQFKTDGNLANLTPEDVQIQGLGPDRKYAYGATYKQYQSTSTVSYVFTIYEDTLGAHPNGYFTTFVFDQDGNSVALADLFTPGSDWLQKLSLLVTNDVTAQIKQRLGTDDVTGAIFSEGLTANADNFQNFAIDSNDLLIEIPPYQVAPYAAGSFEVRVPLSSFQGILK